MADISMCLDNECPSKRECQRHAASGTQANEYRQTYQDFQRPKEAKRCEYFLPLTNSLRDHHDPT